MKLIKLVHPDSGEEILTTASGEDAHRANGYTDTKPHKQKPHKQKPGKQKNADATAGESE